MSVIVHRSLFCWDHLSMQIADHQLDLLGFYPPLQPGYIHTIHEEGKSEEDPDNSALILLGVTVKVPQAYCPA
ncbi:hypothetical protein J6590_096392 [Homalodisca vitripennis]|nr:hypothetical protein J6590_096406 [Homalodisca vitripennis]KAG8279822.1 hypothetical protein J6590_096392 [Homalodisca vitripennis]